MPKHTNPNLKTELHPNYQACRLAAGSRNTISVDVDSTTGVSGASDTSMSTRSLTVTERGNNMVRLAGVVLIMSKHGSGKLSK